MKTKLVSLAGLLLAAGHCWSAPVDLVDITESDVDCVFSLTCTPLATETRTPFRLPGTSGTGYLETHVFRGEAGSLGSNVWAYEYQIDLSGVTATNAPCFTNSVRCFTNSVPGASNVVTCYTNSVPCPGRTPCIESLRIPFGSVYTNLNFGTGGVATVQAYIVTSGVARTLSPVFAQQSGGEIRLDFAPPICPGDSSFAIGLLSTNPPTDIRTTLGLSSGSNAVVAARGPSGGRGTVDCDLRPLAAAIDALTVNDIVAPNRNAKEGRLQALQNKVEAAEDAAEAGHLDEVIEAVMGIAGKAGDRKNSWLTDSASRRLEPILNTLLQCLEESDDDHDDDDDDDDDDDHRKNWKKR